MSQRREAIEEKGFKENRETAKQKHANDLVRGKGILDAVVSSVLFTHAPLPRRYSNTEETFTLHQPVHSCTSVTKQSC